MTSLSMPFRRGFASVRIRALGGALLLVAPMATSGAQAASGSTRKPLGAAETMGPLENDHRFRWMGIGAAVGGLLSFGYYHLSERGERAGKCGPWDCALPYLSISGALTGLFLSRELAAQRRALAPRAGEALTFTATRLRLPSEVHAITVSDSLVFAATDSGVQVVRNAARPVALQRRGAGLSLIRQTALAPRDSLLLIGTGTALWQTPVTSGRLSRLLNGAVDALAAADDIVVAAEGRRLQIRRERADGATIDTLMSPAAVSTAHFDAAARRWWIGADSSLYELLIPPTGAPSLVLRSSVGHTIGAIASGSNWIAATLGTEGVIIWTREMLEPRTVGIQQAPWRLKGEPRFAFDAAFMGSDLYVAGGVDGVTRIRLTPTPTILGASRQAAYATTIVARDGVLWVGDRNGTSLVRLVP